MRKIFSFFLSLFLLLQIFLFSPSTAHAVENCPVTTSPSPVTSNDKFINLTIDTSKFLPPDTSTDPNGSKYLVKLDNTIVRKGTADQRPIDFPTSNGTISVQHINQAGQTEKDTSKAFDARPYTVSVLSSPRGEKEFCASSFTPEYKTAGGTCGIQFLNQKWTVENDIIIQGTNLGNLNEDRRLTVRRDKANGPERYSQCLKASELSNGKNIGKLEAGVYYPEIYKSCGGVTDLSPQKMCFGPNFLIGEKGGFGPSPGPIATPPPICKGGFCETALGKIFTDPANFVKNFFGILLSLAGGVAIILVIISGYRLMASGANPEKVQAAREQLTSAVVGLLFIIFSLSILQIIGVDILKIPGFSK